MFEISDYDLYADTSEDEFSPEWNLLCQNLGVASNNQPSGQQTTTDASIREEDGQNPVISQDNHNHGQDSASAEKQFLAQLFGDDYHGHTNDPQATGTTQPRASTFAPIATAPISQSLAYLSQAPSTYRGLGGASMSETHDTIPFRHPGNLEYHSSLQQMMFHEPSAQRPTAMNNGTREVTNRTLHASISNDHSSLAGRDHRPTSLIVPETAPSQPKQHPMSHFGDYQQRALHNTHPRSPNNQAVNMTHHRLSTASQTPAPSYEAPTVTSQLRSPLKPIPAEDDVRYCCQQCSGDVVINGKNNGELCTRCFNARNKAIENHNYRLQNMASRPAVSSVPYEGAPVLRDVPNVQQFILTYVQPVIFACQLRTHTRKSCTLQPLLRGNMTSLHQASILDLVISSLQPWTLHVLTYFILLRKTANN